MIEAYEFGLVTIDGKKYRSDVILLPERVMDGWWRKEGHRLYVEDLREILERRSKPNVLVVGTGFYGRMKVHSEVESTLKSQGIELIIQPTHEAWKTFNKLLESGKQIAAAFHITC